jgi:molybdopterin converting factor small subunit
MSVNNKVSKKIRLNKMGQEKNMISIIFNAYSFLQKKLREKKQAFSNSDLKLEQGTTINQLISEFHLKNNEVEAVFVNGRVENDFDTVLNDQDRVAFIPPGTPGPYRVMLGFRNKAK